MGCPGGPRCPLTPVLLPFLVLLATAGGQGSPKCQEQAVAAGGELRLLPDKTPQEREKVVWRACLDTGHKLQILKIKNKTAQLGRDSPFYQRVFFGVKSLFLAIRPARTADSGIYWADFEGTAEAVTEPCFRVLVWEPLHKLLLETRILHWEQDRCNLSLLCTVPGATNVSYSWSCTGGHPGALVHQPQLDLQLLGDSDPTVCFCNATNSLNWRMAATNVTASCLSAGLGASWSYCSVKGMLCLLVLGSLGTAVAITHLLLRQRGPPSHGAGTG
ncbi:PREDICTED: uncharacterized protein LOC106897728 [Calidris pugnax]|uniref:uncharacterized protein LOC106897728 n=1 Tax=Calidris pugnax TaxID=198806 RepID=UPI00071D48E7|nr:PREDICTED: uncharacterized protein LOC106897728 [Calidris pugnax]